MAGTAAQRPWLENNGAEQQGPPYGAQETQEDDCSSELFSSDQFRLWCMKVIPCTKRFVHDWTVCPFAHAGEKAVRRDPRLHNYTGIACPDMKKTGSCIRGEKCPYAHNVFEYWLHPTRYRTQLCNDGPTCRRGICFFAHSLEELRVPACKPYVSPEALARASLEAIQQNPHPLGQQLPNPVAAAAQQHAAMAAMGRPGGMRGGRQSIDSAPSSLAASASPFVPNGFHVPSGEPVRYSAPGNSGGGGGGHSPDLPGMHSMGAMHSMHSAEFGGSMPVHHYGGPPQQHQQQRWSGHGPPQHQQQAHHHRHQQQQQQHHQQQFGSMPSGAHPMRGHGGRGGGAPSSAPTNTGMAMAGANMRMQQAQQRGGDAYHSIPARGPSPPGGQRAYPNSFAAMQQQPQAFGSYSSVGQHDAQGDGSVHSRRSMPRSTHSDHPSDEDDASPMARQPSGQQQSSGRASPSALGSTGDLAQSLASLKIALTQQQLAAAAGSNHEVVISTLHQILKDAMAQQSVGAPGGGSFGASGGDQSAAAAAAACAAVAAAAQQQLAAVGGGAGNSMRPYCASPNTAVGNSFGSAPSNASSLTGSVPRFNLAPQDNSAGEAAAGAGGANSGAPVIPSPPFSASPDAIACYEAALVAAAGGYNGMLPLGGVQGQQTSVSVGTPRTSGDSNPSAGSIGGAGGSADDLAAAAAAASAAVAVPAGSEPESSC